jgi:hypothetical protein
VIYITVVFFFPWFPRYEQCSSSYLFVQKSNLGERVRIVTLYVFPNLFVVQEFRDAVKRPNTFYDIRARASSVMLCFSECPKVLGVKCTCSITDSPSCTNKQLLGARTVLSFRAHLASLQLTSYVKGRCHSATGAWLPQQAVGAHGVTFVALFQHEVGRLMGVRG